MTGIRELSRDCLARFRRRDPNGFLLLYGTLCSTEAAHTVHGLGTALAPLGKRTVPGSLYDLGAYPGLILGGGQTIAELYRIEDASILPRLDQFEEYDPCDPTKSLFRRTTIRVPRHTGRKLQEISGTPMIDAWIYVYNGHVGGRSAIVGSSWHDYQATRLGARRGRALPGPVRS